MDALSRLLSGLASYEWVNRPPADPSIRGVAVDSRRLRPGELFVALPGTQVDGHRFVADAIRKGAAAVVVERWDGEPPSQVAVIKVPDTRRAAGLLADAFWGHPSQRMKVVGITGTNGKTTVAMLTAQTLRTLGRSAATIGTLGAEWNEKHLITHHTTPDVVTLHATLAQMAEDGVEFVVMEVSSHALDQQRTAGIRFAGGVFTNISRDHLDYHPTMKDYIFAKKRLFDALPETAFALVNADDRRHRVMLQNTRALPRTYGLRSPADFAGRLLEQTMDGLLMHIDGMEVHLPLVGAYNASNAVAAYAVVRLLGFPKVDALQALSAARGAPGRMEVVHRRPLVVVDYAHTPDAIAQALDALRPLAEGRLWVVFGAGGDRDPGKRPLMGRAAARADKIILTSDNSRSEDPRRIIEDILQGMEAAQRRKTAVIVDRRQAIETALSLAEPPDVVLVAGKGHETYQEIAGKRYPFDDREVIRNWFVSLP